MARYSARWPSWPSAFRTFASVLRSSVRNSALRSWSIVVGDLASNRARTFSFFFNLLSAFEFSREQIVHHQGGDISGNLQVQLCVVCLDVQIELIAPFNQSREQFIHAILFFVRPLTHRIHQLAPALAQVGGGLHPVRDFGSRREELLKVLVVKIWIGILIELSLARVINLELHVQAIVIRNAVLWLMDGRL